ncbi:MAG: rubredoxin [Clostridia bacterium]|nr:rubredoxin [Clostridia bacterium]
MRRFACTVCGFLYDEAAGYPEGGIPPETRWEDLPADWVCPLCGATKGEFEEKDVVGPVSAPAAKPAATGTPAPAAVVPAADETDVLRELTAGELAALCSNLAKGCDKQYRPEEAGLFRQLSDHYAAQAGPASGRGLGALAARIEEDLATGYPAAGQAAAAAADRGAKRALVWGEKVTRILASLLSRYEKQGDALLEGTRVYVCEICGFVYVGDNPPEICPVCKVPSMKIAAMERR